MKHSHSTARCDSIKIKVHWANGVENPKYVFLAISSINSLILKKNSNLDRIEVILDPIKLDTTTLASGAHRAIHVLGVLEPDVGRGFVYRLVEESH